jgi:sugar (pentulose or hexulose) kinase
LGAAVLAGVGSGVYADVKTGAEIFQRGDRVVEPDPKMEAAYIDLYGTYRRHREKWKHL